MLLPAFSYACRKETEGSKILKDLTAKVNRRKEDEAIKVKIREQEEAGLKPGQILIHEAAAGGAAGTSAAPAAEGDDAPVVGVAAEDIAKKMELALEKSDAMSSAPVAPSVFQELIVQLPVSTVSYPWDSGSCKAISRCNSPGPQRVCNEQLHQLAARNRSEPACLPYEVVTGEKAAPLKKCGSSMGAAGMRIVR